MSFIMVGLLVSLIAWLVNRYFVINLGSAGLIAVAPILEEVLKTGGAVLLGADIFFVHAFFGAAEAVIDINTGAHSKSAGILSFLGHLLFGYLAAVAYHIANIWWALIAGIVVHILWNFSIVLLVSMRNKGDLQ
ncbi:MAG: hypothetical protein PWQ96_864 [Clostridia bacterium]|jgi:hypothetical protein|nr:hypothetical protein [Clostridiales bacterium]MDK2985222.1 hypothetical protein [Clostridia bacterium]